MIFMEITRKTAMLLASFAACLCAPTLASAEAEWRDDEMMGWLADIGVWDYSPRMGFVYTELKPWVYSFELGWIYGVGGGEMLYWWMPYLDWLLDFEQGYPFLVHLESNQLLYVLDEDENKPLFEDKQGRVWRFLDDEHIMMENGSLVPARRLVVDPAYPLILRQMGIEGSVGLLITIDERGKVVPDDIVVETSTDMRFNQPAIDAIKLWRFAPGTDADGNFLRGRMRAPFNFKLNRR